MKTIKEVTKGKPVFSEKEKLHLAEIWSEYFDNLWLWEEVKKNENSAC